MVIVSGDPIIVISSIVAAVSGTIVLAFQLFLHTMPLCVIQGCNSCDGDIQSFGSTDALFTAEAQTTSRYILAGHRYASTPYHTIPYHTISYHTIPYHPIPFHTIPYNTMPYQTIPHHTVSYHTIPVQGGTDHKSMHGRRAQEPSTSCPVHRTAFIGYAIDVNPK